ncbi:MAG: BlaI/MecI/CopY family transcriptional regulator [Planctomycetota bacterium]
MQPFSDLSMRERQIAEVLQRLGRATVAEVVAGMTDDVSYNSVRVTLAGLERKGTVKHSRDGRRYVYALTQRRDRARTTAVRHLLDTFFDGSASGAVSTLLRSESLSDDELEELEALIANVRRQRRS